MNRNLMEKIVSLAKRRGFIFQSSSIYGGLSSAYDYGPLGVLLKNNIKKVWWEDIVQKREDILGIDSAIFMHPNVWKASGHLKSFSDPLIECKSCHKRFRADKIGKQCPECESKEFTEVKMFNLMFKTFMGPVEEESSIVYLRPETCQGIFVNFKNILQTTRVKIPFGVAQIGKSFRNEITPSNFIFRTREFEQMELEYFVKPDQAKKWYKYWKNERFNWYLNLGIKKENLRLREYKKDELAHYASACTDIEYKFPFGWDEVEGIANRTDYDLKEHSKFSGQDLKYLDPKTRERYYPYVIEPSAGVDRLLLMFLIDSYEEIKGGRRETTKSTKEIEYLLKLHPRLAPIKAAIFPLIKKEPLVKLAREIYSDLKNYWFVYYDESGTIGRRYRRQDEIGTPYCLTIDFESLKNQTLTVRDRDTMDQVRIKIKEIKDYLEEKLNI